MSTWGSKSSTKSYCPRCQTEKDSNIVHEDDRGEVYVKLLCKCGYVIASRLMGKEEEPYSEGEVT